MRIWEHTDYTNISTDMHTHLWKHISMFGKSALEIVGNTLTFTVCESFLKFLNLGNPCIWTLSHNTETPGLNPGEFCTGKPGDSCSVAFLSRVAD